MDCLCVTWKQDLGVARTTADTMKAPPSPDCSACSWYTATPFTCRKLAQRRFSPRCVVIFCANMLGCSSAYQHKCVDSLCANMLSCSSTYQHKCAAQVHCPHDRCMAHVGVLSQPGSCRLVQSFYVYCRVCTLLL